MYFFLLPKERPNWNALSTREKILAKFFPLAKAIKSDIITAGRDDACGWAFPSAIVRSRLPISVGWRLYFLCFFPLPKERPNWNALSTREKIIATMEKISKSVMISPPLPV